MIYSTERYVIWLQQKVILTLIIFNLIDLRCTCLIGETKPKYFIKINLRLSGDYSTGIIIY
jgi:hypothetical protein